ncbi:MAG: carboxypeptidase regulatory-like domain-containing protein [Polyangiales bacterium]
MDHRHHILAALSVALVACSGANSDNGDDIQGADGSASGDGSGSDVDPGAEFAIPDDAGPAPCVGLKCQQVACAGAATTSLSGIVYDPAGRTPLYNVIVYVPNAPLDPIPKPLSCDKCGAVASGSPIVTTLTDAKGQFTLKNVPAGKNIPLVMQVGKWRRQVVIPDVKECVDTPITDKNLTRLPKSRKEGDIPQFAVTTGQADELECFLREIGIDDSEFVPGGGKGAVHLFQGYGGSTVTGIPQASVFWSTFDNLKYYDIVILSCEGAEHPESKPATATAAMMEYVDKGGRVFASHYHYYWFKHGPAALQSTATWTGGGTASPYDIDMSFPKGKAFGEWLVNVGASTTLGQIDLSAVKNDVGTVNTTTTQRWVYKTAGGESVKYLSFATPIGKPKEEQCGRAVFSDIHISNASGGGAFPSSCKGGGDFSPQEKALEFLLFDLSSCLQADGDPPKPPPVK